MKSGDFGYFIGFAIVALYIAIGRGWEPSEQLVRYAIGGVFLGIIVGIVTAIRALWRRYIRRS